MKSSNQKAAKQSRNTFTALATDDTIAVCADECPSDNWDNEDDGKWGDGTGTSMSMIGPLRPNTTLQIEAANKLLKTTIIGTAPPTTTTTTGGCAKTGC